MAEKFPKDCWDKKCPHFHRRALSIDDLVCTKSRRYVMANKN